MEAAVVRLRRCRNGSLVLVYLAAILLAATAAAALSDAEASDIARRQLLSLREGDGDLPDDFEFDIHVDVTFANERLRRAYVALQAWRRAMYSDPKNFTGGWVGADVCSYFGVTCVPALDDANTTVVAGIDLNGGDIAGYLPAELGMLTDIAFFHINSNRFCGIIPKSFSRLTLLHELDVSNNRFVGGFPDVVLQIPVLKYLDLRFNDFDGTLPPHLFDKDLDAIFVNSNRFVGFIPENFGNSTATVVVLANNAFIGCIPRSVGRMADTLDELMLLNNRLDGCIPPELAELVNSTVVDVSGNALVGTLPEGLVNMIRLEQLDVSRNQLAGAVAENVCKLPALANFSFAHNFFSVEAEACVPSEDSPVALDDSGNCLDGGRPGQKPLPECALVMLVIDLLISKTQ
ncbi:Leucine-rich repeat (LRR) family protein [Zea mays]|uniref:Cell wall hydroxyproline-rich glycoprotein n=1 Tax=Zea mays TaxID=4577 RepID=A0A1D6IWC4_MAIZE|nr:Leucine-rich repeat (LRR) family protein [Zea mays]